MNQQDEIERAVRVRAGDKCELCGSTADLRVAPVPPDATTAERCILACAVCSAQLAGEAPLDEKHWFCLREAAWSEVPAVQVASLRLLDRLTSAAWAQELRGQLYVADELQAWVDADPSAAGAGEATDEATRDSNGTVLVDGDSVALIKDLDVKGAGFVAKRGTIVKGIRLTGDPENIEGKINNTTLVLKTKFLKKG